MKRNCLFSSGMLAALAGMTLGTGPAMAGEYHLGANADLSVHGYLRQYMSWNLQDQPETATDDSGRLSMVRSQARVDTVLQGSCYKFVVGGRGVREVETDYQNDLEHLGANAKRDLMGRYNRLSLREGYGEFEVGDRTTLRIGRQQIVWGETDFFVASDLVHGFDYSWRMFVEPENEELRKPLNLANAMVQVPELNGSLQAFVRPGLDSERDIGNTYDIWGGRWAFEPYRGFDSFSIMRYDYNHPDGDKKDVTYGARWRGEAGPANYSLLYLKGFNPDPVLNTAANPWHKTPGGTVGDLIYPKIETVGGTLSAPADAIDTVFSAELAYTFNKPFNFDDNGSTGMQGSGVGIRQRDMARWMVRADHNLDLQNILGTDRPSFFSVQLFDSWLPNYKDSDNLLYKVGYQNEQQEHAFTLTSVVNFNYFHETVNPGLAAGWDMTYGGGFVIPSVEFVMGDNFRLRAEADLFFSGAGQSRAANSSTDTTVFSFMDHSSQFLLRGTYQY